MAQAEFVIDKQTARDLGLFSVDRNAFSVFSIFNKTRWAGSELKLENLFETPLTDIVALRRRVETLKYLGQMSGFMDFSREELKFIEIYLSYSNLPDGVRSLNVLKQALCNRFKPDNEYYVYRRGTESLARLLLKLDSFFAGYTMPDAPPDICSYLERINGFIHNTALQSALSSKRKGIFVSARLDFYFRVKEKEKIREILDIIYEIDALRSVALTALEHGYAYPAYSESESVVNIRGLYHPFLSEPVKNDAEMSGKQNICFLTGPNMAGKSTYMKAFGIAVYLAHIGFPVPAESLEISIFNGLFTTINLSDNINLGYSHYFNEVLRVKQVAEKIVQLKSLVVIFDELFRGTNVKDAYDASLAVISALAGLHRNIFLISTHILEVAEELKLCDTIDFRCFEIRMEEGEPRYTYRLRPGVSSERIGMYILNREKVVETIREAGAGNNTHHQVR